MHLARRTSEKKAQLKLALVVGAGALIYLGLVVKNALQRKREEKETNVSGETSLATGVLMVAVRNDQAFTPDFTDVTLPDGTIVSVANDMLKLDGLRMPVSWPDTIEIGKKFGWVAPSQKIADAIYAAAPTKTVFHSLVTASDPASGGEEMHTYKDVRKYNADIDAQLAAKGYSSGLQSGAEKYWLLDERLGETVAATGKPAAVNYGAWDASGHALQPRGGRHDINYVGDYSQLLRPIQRYGKDKNGNKVDLLDWMVANDNVPRAFADLFKA